jgi:hypothetical protein
MAFSEALAARVREALGRLSGLTGKPMKSMIYVDPAGLESEEALRQWVRRAVSYTSSLPAKV